MSISTLKARLARYKAKTYGTLAEHVRWTEEARCYAGTWQPGKPAGRYYMHGSALAHLRSTPCDKVGEIYQRIDHEGWFCDEFQDETMRGYVVQLPARNGEPQYYAAYGWSGGDGGGVTIDTTCVYDEPMDAARASDGMAERAAESEREYQAEESRKLRIEELQDEIVKLRAERQALVRELKATRPKFGPMVCSALRSSMAALKEASHAAWTELRTLT